VTGAQLPSLGWFAFVPDLLDDPEAAGRIAATPARWVNLALTYHSARDVLPGNPRRSLRYLDGGRYFFRPDRRRYGGLPAPAVDPEIAAGDDPLPGVLARLGRAGLGFNAWVVLCHDPPLLPPHQDLCQRNVFGDPMLTDLCPASPLVRSWALALIGDVARLGPRAVLIESAHYHGLRHGYHHERYLFELGGLAELALSLCFCAHCEASAVAAGVDIVAARGWARAQARRALDGERGAGAPPDLAPGDLTGAGADAVRALIAHRCSVVTALATDLATALAAAGVGAVFLDPAGSAKGYADGRPAGAPAVESGWRFGVDVAAIAAAGLAVGVLGYARSPDRLRADLGAYRSLLPGAVLRLALRPGPPDCSDAANLAAKLTIAAEAGVSAVDIYHFGLVTRAARDRVGAAVRGRAAAP